MGVGSIASRCSGKWAHAPLQPAAEILGKGGPFSFSLPLIQCDQTKSFPWCKRRTSEVTPKRKHTEDTESNDESIPKAQLLYKIVLKNLNRLTLSLTRVPSSKLREKSWISFRKISKNKQYHMKVLLNSFHLNGHILRFHPTFIDSRFDSGSERVKQTCLQFESTISIALDTQENVTVSRVSNAGK